MRIGRYLTGALNVKLVQMWYIWTMCFDAFLCVQFFPLPPPPRTDDAAAVLDTAAGRSSSSSSFSSPPTAAEPPWSKLNDRLQAAARRGRRRATAAALAAVLKADWAVDRKKKEGERSIYMVHAGPGRQDGCIGCTLYFPYVAFIIFSRHPFTYALCTHDTSFRCHVRHS